MAAAEPGGQALAQRPAPAQVRPCLACCSQGSASASQPLTGDGRRPDALRMGLQRWRWPCVRDGAPGPLDLAAALAAQEQGLGSGKLPPRADARLGRCCSSQMKRARSENQMYSAEGSQQGGNLWRSLGLSMHVMSRAGSVGGSKHGSQHSRGDDSLHRCMSPGLAHAAMRAVPIVHRLRAHASSCTVVPCSLPCSPPARPACLPSLRRALRLWG